MKPRPFDEAALLGQLAAATTGCHSLELVRERAASLLREVLGVQRLQLQADPAHLEGLAPEQVARALAAGPHVLSQGRSQVILLPLLQGTARVGAAALHLEGRTGLRPELLGALAQLLANALGHVRLVERLAGLSRRAHQRTQELTLRLADRSEPEPLVARSPAMLEVLAAADLVARHATPVLLRGETGTGKEVLARRIHQRSRRARQAFVAVNCGALPAGLVESELFGHEAGAFSGAHRRHTGLFERASGGTLLLDEVAELPLAAQVKLLRVLQQGEVHRVGAEVALPVDVRVIAATHRPLEQMVAEGSFRGDLFYRLDVFPILLPPLRERRGDLPALAAALIERITRRLGRRPAAPAAALLAYLEAQPWPGNVRELENVLERALILLPDDARELGPPTGAGTGPRGRGPTPPTTELRFDAAVRRHLESVLAGCGGKIYGPGGAAERLGLKPTTLQSKLRKLGVRGAGRG